MKGPLHLTCPLCEKPAYRMDHRRDYTKPGLNVTIWYHGGPPCFVIDDLISAPPKKAGALFEITPLQETKPHA